MTPEPPAKAPPRRFIAAAAAVAVGTSVVGSAIAPWLLAHAPAVLLALAPEPRHVVLTTPLLDGWVIIPLTVARRVLGLTALYFFGAAYGEGAITFVEERFGTMGRMLRWVQRNLGRLGAWLVLLLPMPSVCVLAGVGHVRFARTLLAMTLGQCFWVSLTWAFGDLASPVVEPVVAWLRAHALEATVACVVVVALWQGHAYYRRRLAPMPKPPDPED